MFVDETKLLVQAGKGGDGAILFRREIYVPRGGPDGGDGGRGGNVIIEAQRNLHALSHLAAKDRIKAQDGDKGGHRTSTGKSGENAVIQVPLGTEIYELGEDNTRTLLYELKDEGQVEVVAKGGNGGWGNWRFKSSIQQVPDRANPGQAGEEKQLLLVLKLIADVGLVGLPNAGKSTFLSVVSAAHPKIANYPFTTLEPQLGVAHLPDKRQLIIADLPGLIEGASKGKGLGVDFLKHTERTGCLIHFLSCEYSQEEMVNQYKTIRNELTNWSAVLAKKPEIIALSKADLLLPEALEKLQKAIAKQLKKEVFVVSAATHFNLIPLLGAAYTLVENSR